MEPMKLLTGLVSDDTIKKVKVVAQVFLGLFSYVNVSISTQTDNKTLIWYFIFYFVFQIYQRRDRLPTIRKYAGAS